MNRSDPHHGSFRAAAQRGAGAGPTRCALVGAAALALIACQSPAAPTVGPSSASTPTQVAAPGGATAAPAGTAIRITAPASGATVPSGEVRVAFEVAGVRLVPAAQARRPDEFHVHVLLDVDPALYVGTTTAFPIGNPNIVHTAAQEVTFKDVAPGDHRLTVVMSGPDHVSLRTPVSAEAAFKVA